MQLQGDICIFGGVTSGFFEGNLVKGQLIFAFTRNLFKSDGFVLQPTFREAVHIVTPGNAIENVGLQHGIKRNPTQLNAVIRQNTAIVFQVLPDLQRLFIFQQRF
ncbi:hypothetical protein BvCmsSIP076_02108 [Escherichia coli]|nr:hypothetical protein BvCmsSIP076_02108 [Escherichia coli]